MTRYIDRPQAHDLRETRVRVPQHMSAAIFQGWGPKF